jgi:phage antirepressor YoqD-like protein
VMMTTIATMTSLEIAELVGSRHDDVKRSIERLAERGVTSLPPMAEVKIQRERRAETVTVYRFDGEQGKRDSIVVVAQLSPEFTARLVDRWQELEGIASAAAFAVPQTLGEALRLAADLEEQRQRQAAQLEQQRPAVEFVDRYVEAQGALGFRQVCKLLRANEAAFRAFLINRKVMYMLAGNLTPYQQHLDAGRFQVRAGVNEQSQHAFTQAKFTPKGVQWIAGLWMGEQLNPSSVTGGRDTEVRA